MKINTARIRELMDGYASANHMLALHEIDVDISKELPREKMVALLDAWDLVVEIDDATRGKHPKWDDEHREAFVFNTSVRAMLVVDG